MWAVRKTNHKNEICKRRTSDCPVCCNTFSVTPVIVGKRYITTKTKEADRHGIGLENIKETVGKYDGSCVIKHDDDNFKVAILIHNQEK